MRLYNGYVIAAVEERRWLLPFITSTRYCVFVIVRFERETVNQAHFISVRKCIKRRARNEKYSANGRCIRLWPHWYPIDIYINFVHFIYTRSNVETSIQQPLLVSLLFIFILLKTWYKIDNCTQCAQHGTHAHSVRIVRSIIPVSVAYSVCVYLATHSDENHIFFFLLIRAARPREPATTIEAIVGLRNTIINYLRRA